ncbi:MAG: tetratricopeptide repeat protein [Microcoleus sp. SU_5_3]|nr:tetratricopeptide repeat protein [Microcoleus sp. SU_5_3]
MSKPIDRLHELVCKKLGGNHSVDSVQLVSELESEIEADPQFAGLLRTNHLMIQINQGDAQAFQTLVQGGIAYFGGNHLHLAPEQLTELEPEKLEEILKQLIPKLTNTKSISLGHQPPNTSGFQGRLKEIDQLKQGLRGDRIRLVGIVSPVGYGKSTLTARIYEEPSTFEQKLWITFNKPCSFSDFCSGLLDKIGQKVNNINNNCNDESLTNTLINFFSNHSFLLVLDNLESLLNQERQFIDIGYQKFLLQWLENQNASTILFTSREQPAALKQVRNDLQWLQLKGMTDDDGIQLLTSQEITGSYWDLQRFTQIVDGHPLLLKLAASWLHDRPTDTADVQHILNERDLNLFEELVGIHRGDPEASIGKLLASSMERLTPRLRELWLNLSVYKYRSIDLAAAQAVATESITDTDLRELAKRSLLEEQKSQGQWQYHFLKLVKDFAQQQAGDRTEAKLRAIEYCRSVAKPSGWDENEAMIVIIYRQISKPRNWKNQGDVAEYLEIFHYYYELGEYASAFDFLWSTGCDAFLELRGYNSIRVELYLTLKQVWASEISHLEAHLNVLSAEQRNTFDFVQTLFAEMLNCLGTAYRYLGKYVPAIDLHSQALDRFRKIENRDREQAVSLNNLGKVYSAQGEYQKAVDSIEEAREIFHRINDALGEFLSLQDLIDTDSARGEHQKNIERYKSLLTLYRQFGDRLQEGNTLNKLGSTYQKIGQYQDAVEPHLQALKIFQELDDKQGQAVSWHRLGDAYEAFGRHQEAIDAHQQAFQLNDNRLEQAHTLCGLGWDLLSSGESEKAIETYEQAIAIFRELGDRQGEANALNGLGVANANLGNYPQAESYYREALNIHREFKNCDGEAVVCNNLGSIYEAVKDYQKAIESYQQSLQISNGIRDRDLNNDAKTRNNLGRVCNLMGQIYYNQRQYQQAAQFYQQALSAFEGIQGAFRIKYRTQEREVTALLGLGNAKHFLGQFSEAMNLHQRTLEISRRLGDLPGIANALLGLADVYCSLGNYEKPDDKNAIKFYEEALSIFRELGAKQGETRVKLGLGKTYHSLGQLQEAIKYLDEGGS